MEKARRDGGSTPKALDGIRVVGEHNQAVFCDQFGLSPQALDGLSARRVI